MASRGMLTQTYSKWEPRGRFQQDRTGTTPPETSPSRQYAQKDLVSAFTTKAGVSTRIDVNHKHRVRKIAQTERTARCCAPDTGLFPRPWSRICGCARWGFGPKMRFVGTRLAAMPTTWHVGAYRDRIRTRVPRKNLYRPGVYAQNIPELDGHEEAAEKGSERRRVGADRGRRRASRRGRGIRGRPGRLDASAALTAASRNDVVKGFLAGRGRAMKESCFQTTGKAIFRQASVA